jgi:hypothetical protein
MLFLNVYYFTLCRLYEKHLILNEVKNWQVCYSRVVTLTVAHYIVDLPKSPIKVLQQCLIVHLNP